MSKLDKVHFYRPAGSGSGILAGLGRQTGIRLYMLSQLVDLRFECGALTSPWFFP